MFRSWDHFIFLYFELFQYDDAIKVLTQETILNISFESKAT